VKQKLSEESLLKIISFYPNYYTQYLDSQIAAQKANTFSSQQLHDLRVVVGTFMEFNNRPVFPNEFLISAQDSQQVSFQQRTPYGISYELGVSRTALTPARSSGSPAVPPLYYPRVFAELNLSLLKNFLGRLDQSQLRAQELNELIQDVETNQDFYEFNQLIRQAYWGAIYTLMQQDYYEKLFNDATVQLDIMTKRSSAGVSDKGDVARAKAEVSNRKLQLSENKRILIDILNGISQFIPGSHAEVSDLPSVTLDFFQRDVYFKNKMELLEKSISLILSKKETPLEWSSLNDIVSNLDEFKHIRKVMIEQQQSFDIQGSIGAELVGIDIDESDAIDQISSYDNDNYSASLYMVVPLLGKEGEALSAKSQQIELELNSYKNQIITNLNEAHEYAVRNFVALRESLSASKEAVTHLEESVANVKTKYDQGRVDYIELVREEETLRKAALTYIRLQNNYLNEMLAYLMFFDRAPLPFNIDAPIKGSK
jgi:outer membrane protein TolC